MRTTGDRSKISAPALAAAFISPTHALYGSKCALPRLRIAPRAGDSGLAPHRARRQPLLIETRARAQSILRPQPLFRVCIGRVEQGVAVDEIARDPMLPDDRHEIAHGVATQLPDAPACLAAVTAGQLTHALIRLLQQKRGACGCAAVSDARRLEHNDVHVRLGKGQRRQRAGDAAANDRDVHLSMTRQRRIPRPRTVRLPSQPERPPSTQERLSHSGQRGGTFASR